MAMEVAAAKATEEPREGRARQKARKAASQTVRMGERKRSSTLWKKCGLNFMLVQLLMLGWRGTYNPTISRKRKHHPRIRCHREKSAMPNTNHNQTHQDHCPIRSKNIYKDLKNRLSVILSRVNGVSEILDTE